MEVLSEHCCQGWLEGYLLTGRMACGLPTKPFAQVVDSMLTQHAKWLEQCRDFPWRRPLASLNVYSRVMRGETITTVSAIRRLDL